MRQNYLPLTKALYAVLCVLLLSVAGITKAQQPSQTKLTDYNFRNLNTIEERVFLLHSIQENEFFSYVLSDEEGKIDIFVSNEYTCLDSDANSDFDFFLENLYDEWTAYSNLDKTERGSLYVEWRYELEDEVFLAINEDFHSQLRYGNSTCEGALEFASINGVYEFPASVNAGNLGSSMPPYYCSGFSTPHGNSSCLYTTPNPAFYYIQIAEPGNLNIYMYSTPSHDIDFDCWGPFSEIETACSQLSCSNLVDCSYSASATENCYINNAQSGQFYILLITNYSNQSGTIYFQNIGSGSSGCIGQKTVTAIVNPVDGGTVTGGGEYECGSSCTLTAVANEGYVFMDWTNSNGVVLSTEEEYTFTVWSDINIKANFVEASSACYLTFDLNDSNGDGWSGNYLVLNFEDGSCQKLTIPREQSIASFILPFADGTPISLDWVFGSNADQCSFMVSYSNGNVIQYGSDMSNGHYSVFDVDCVGMPGNPMLFDVAAEVNPIDGGSIIGTGQFGFNETCTLTAMAGGGYEFVNWTEDGVIVSTDPTYSFYVARNRNLVANFSRYANHWIAESYTNSMFMIGVVKIDGIEQTSPDLELGAFCNNECRGSEFPVYEDGQWLYYMTMGGSVGDNITFRLYDHALEQELNLYCFNEIPFEIYGLIGMDEPYEVLFAKLFTVSVIVDPEDAGTVSGAGTYINGAEVTLTATTNGNSTFINWTVGDEPVSSDTVYSFIVTEDLEMVAHFLPKYEVTASVNPMESGTVAGTGMYDKGTECTLIATANAGYVFSHWSIDSTIVSTEPSYTFAVMTPVNLTANFGVLCTVSAVVSPENAGTVLGEGEYIIGSQATLTAIANEGFVFNSWAIDGEVVSTEPSYTFVVTGATTFTANFDVLCSVSATVSPDNAGTILGLGEYVLGTEVTLSAIANEGYAFNSWTIDGEVVSTDSSYTFIVLESLSLMANFDVLQSQQLTIGWNWWSTNLDITVDELKAALVAALPGTSILIKSKEKTAAYNPVTNRWKGILGSFDVMQMYMIYVSTGCEIELAGSTIIPSEHSITISTGNNWIAFPFSESMSINEALAGFPAVNGDMIKSKSNNAIFIRGEWRGAVTTFEPGQGYIFISNVQEDRILAFPAQTK